MALGCFVNSSVNQIMEKSKIIKNFGFLSLSEVVTRIISFFVIIFIARYLGDVGLGTYSFVFAFCGILLGFSDMGAKDFIVRDISKNKSLTQKYLNNLLVLKLLFAVVMVGIAVLIINLLGYQQDVIKLVYLTLAIVFIESLNHFFCTFFWAHEMMEVPTIAFIAERIVAGPLVIAMLVAGYKLNVILNAFLISQIISFFVLFPRIKKIVNKVRLEFDFKFWKNIVATSWPFWVTGLCVYVYYRTDIIMLSFFRETMEIGWYSAAYKVIDTLTTLAQIVILAVFPMLSQLNTSAKGLYQKTFNLLFVIIFPIAIGSILLAPRIIYFIYRQQFINSAIALQILVWAEVFLFINFMMGYLLNALNKQRLFMKATIVCVVTNIFFNLVLIPKFGFKGAAIATVITQAINFVVLYRYTKKEGFGINIPKLIYKPVLVGLAMGLVVFTLRFLPILVLIPFAGLFYFGILYLINGIDKDAIKQVWGIK